MAKKKLKILVIFDMNFNPGKNNNYLRCLKRPEWVSDRDVILGLKKLGHDIKLLGIYNDISLLMNAINEETPDLVFNMCLRFENDANYASHIMSLLELLKVKFTGNGSLGTKLCQDKALSKKIVCHHNILVPEFIVSPLIKPLRRLNGIHYPAIVKPLNMDGSVGITNSSFVRNEKHGLTRIDYIHKRFEMDAIVEEYIDGREFQVGVLGNKRLTVLPPREVCFSKIPNSKPKIYTEYSKWVKKYRSKWGIHYRPVTNISKDLQKKINKTCKVIYKKLHLKGYARFDFRLKKNGEIFFLEANPNPGISKHDNLTLAANEEGINYYQLLDKIIRLAFE